MRSAADGDRETERFESIGREPLRFEVSRRGLLPAALEWLHASSAADGVPALRLGELGTMPDEELAEMTPAVVPGLMIHVRDGAVWGRSSGSGTPVRLLSTKREDLCAFNAMNGSASLGEIAALVAAETAWPDERAFAFARGLFLHLVELRVCAPTECE